MVVLDIEFRISNFRFSYIESRISNLESGMVLLDFRIYHTVGTILKFKRKIVGILYRGKIDIFNTHIHDHSLPWLSTDTSITISGVKIVNLFGCRIFVTTIVPAYFINING